MAPWSFIESDAIRVISHIVRLGMEQILFLDEVNAVRIRSRKLVSSIVLPYLVVMTAKGIVASCDNIRINKYALQ